MGLLNMKRKIIATERAPGAIGPYSQGMSAGPVVFTSGQLPIDMATGQLVVDDIRRAAACALDNVKAILQADGLGMKDIVKTTVYLTNLEDFASVNEVYATYFDAAPPARSCVQVAALPKGAPIEIEAIAVKLW